MNLNSEYFSNMKISKDRTKPTPEVQSDKPRQPPQTRKDFKKMVQADDPDNKKEQEELAVNEEKAESLFDLSGKGNKPTTARVRSPQVNREIRSILNPETEFAKETNHSSSKKEKTEADEEPFIRPNQSDQTTNDELDAQILAANDDQATAKNQLLKDRSLTEEISREHTTTERPKSSRLGSLSLETDATGFASKEKKGVRPQRVGEFSQENPDLASINPNTSIASILPDAKEIEVDDPVATRMTIKDLVDQIVKSMQVSQKEGQTDTTITLRHPPLVEGAQVTLTSFTTAQKEFNIAFTGLSLQAKQFLDTKQDALSLALHNKGFVVHMITTTTLAEAPSYNSGSDQFNRRDNQRERGGNSQRGSKQEDLA